MIWFIRVLRLLRTGWKCAGTFTSWREEPQAHLNLRICYRRLSYVWLQSWAWFYSRDIRRAAYPRQVCHKLSHECSWQFKWSSVSLTLPNTLRYWFIRWFWPGFRRGLRRVNFRRARLPICSIFQRAYHFEVIPRAVSTKCWWFVVRDLCWDGWGFLSRGWTGLTGW